MSRRVVARLSSPAAQAAVVVVALVSLFLAGYVLVAQLNLTSCIASYNEASARANSARAEAVDQLNAANALGTKAEDDLWSAVNSAQSLPPEQQRAAGQAAFALFLKQRAQAQHMRDAAAADRARHPLPSPPSQRCG